MLKNIPQQTNPETAGSSAGPVVPPLVANDGADTRKGVQSVEHAFSLLQIFSSANQALAIKDLAEASGMPASKVHHYLVSLVRTGVVRQTVDSRYELGAYALHLGLAAMRRLEPVELAVNAARRLRDETLEATFISVWGNHGPTIIRYMDGIQPVTVGVRAGQVLPLANSATGRVFMTWGGDKLIESVVTREQIDPKTMEKIQRDTRADGMGRVDGDLLPRIASLAVPVFDQEGRLALTITQLGWTGEFDSSTQGVIGSALKRRSEQLSSDLGYNAQELQDSRGADVS